MPNVNASTRDRTKTGTLTVAQPTPGTPVTGGTVVQRIGTGQAGWRAILAGTFSLGTQIISEGTLDGTTWRPIPMEIEDNPTAPPAITFTGGSPLSIRGGCTGWQQVRVRAAALATGDSVSVALRSSIAAPPPSRIVLLQTGPAVGPPLVRIPRGRMGALGSVAGRQRAPGRIIHTVGATAINVPTNPTTYTTQAFGLEGCKEVEFFVSMSGTPSAGPTGLVLNFYRFTHALNGTVGLALHPDDAAQTLPAPGTTAGFIGSKAFTRLLGAGGLLTFQATGPLWAGSSLTLIISMVRKG